MVVLVGRGRERTFSDRTASGTAAAMEPAADRLLPWRLVECPDEGRPLSTDVDDDATAAADDDDDDDDDDDVLEPRALEDFAFGALEERDPLDERD